MRYELSDDEWAAIKPMLPNKPRGVPRVDDRRVLNGIFWVLRSGAPWRDLPGDFGPYTTCYNRFVRWRRAGVWTRIMDALATAHDASVQMIDTSIVRVHQHGACITRNRRQSMGRSRGGLTSKIHALVDTNGLPVRLALTAGEAHDNRLARKLLSRLKSKTMLLADRGYDADWIRALAAAGKHDDQVDALGLIGQLLDTISVGNRPTPPEKEKPKSDYRTYEGEARLNDWMTY
jgi:transposase